MTADRIDAAISSGSRARVTADARSTAAQPSSIASAASLAVPMPASSITGTDAACTISSMLCGFLMPRPEPMGAPSGITAAHPACSSRRASTGSSLVYGSTVKPSATSCSAASSSSTGSGRSVISSAITSSLTQFVPSASAASRAVRTASAAVKQPAVFGSTLMPRSASTSSTEPRAAGSTRRIATVVSSVPEAASARPSTSRLGLPPVPMIRREPNFSPASDSGSSVSGSAMSASLHRGEDLDLIAVREPDLRPGHAAHDVAVDRYRDAGSGRRYQRDCPVERGRVRHLMRVAVDHDFHQGSRPLADEALRQEWRGSGGTRAAHQQLCDQVGGDRGEQYAAAEMAGSEDQSRQAGRADHRRVVRGAWPQPSHHLGELKLGDSWHDRAGVAQQLPYATGGDRRVRAHFLLGRADHEFAVVPWHQVDLASLSEPAHGPVDQRW